MGVIFLRKKRLRQRSQPFRASRNMGRHFYEKIKTKEGKLFFIKSENTRHNIFGLWSLQLMDQLEADLERGERKVEVWADSIGVNTVNIDYKKPDPFFNINTQSELEEAQLRIKAS